VRTYRALVVNVHPDRDAVESRPEQHEPVPEAGRCIQPDTRAITPPGSRGSGSGPASSDALLSTDSVRSRRLAGCPELPDLQARPDDRAGSNQG